MLDNAELDRIIAIGTHFEERKSRAKERLERSEGRSWCFAIIGLKMEPNEYSVDGFFRLRKIEEPPGEIELAGALKSAPLFSAIGRYSHGISHELSINSALGSDQAPFNIGWWIISALRVRTSCDFLVPAVADMPWDTVAAAPANSVHCQLLEDFPKAFRLDPSSSISHNDLNWVSANVTSFAKLAEMPAVRLAVEAATTHQHHANLRMATASLWAGIEALFQVTQELRFRIAALVASILEPPGEARFNLYREMKQLYDFRSRAVHGIAVNEEELHLHIQTTRNILSRVLCKVVEHGKVFSNEEIERRLFGCV